MSESLRKTLGFDFDFDKFVRDDDGEQPGPVVSEPLPVPGASSSPEEEDRFDSMGDSADHVLAQYMEMAKTPPRATRRQKEKKAYRSQTQAAGRHLRSSLRRHSSLEQYLSLPLGLEQAGQAAGETPEQATEPPGAAAGDPAAPGDGEGRRRRQRQQQRDRRAERHFKFVLGSPAAASRQDGRDNMDDRCASVKVEMSSCFQSLSSKPVSQDSPARQHSPEQSQSRAGAEPAAADRAELHRQLARLIRLGTAEPAPEPDRRGEVRYQSELQDVLWLALQAYRARQPMHVADRTLCRRRAQLPELARRLLAFRCQPAPVAGCLDVWCAACLARQRRGLAQVTALLDEVAAAERLYPSSARLRQQQPAFAAPELSRRLQTLLVWRNLTTQLWTQMHIIRQYLQGMGAGRLPWPQLQPEEPDPGPGQPGVPDPGQPGEPGTGQPEEPGPSQPGKPGLGQPGPIQPAAGAGGDWPYRRCVERLLKRGGLRRAVARLAGPPGGPLSRAQAALLPAEPADGELCSSGADGGSLGLDERTAAELRRHGERSPAAGQMALPSLQPVYVWLSRLPLQVAHQCLRSRLQQQPREPSALSIRQLIAECREALRVAVMARGLLLRRLRVIRPPAAGVSCSAHPDAGAPCSSPPDAGGSFSAPPAAETSRSAQPDDGARCSAPPDAGGSCSAPPDTGVPCSASLDAGAPCSAPPDAGAPCSDPPEAGAPCSAPLDAGLEQFDADVKLMLEVYLGYVKQLLLMMQGRVQVSSAQRSLLEEEWNLCRRICPHIAGGEAIAGRSFCYMVSDILPAIGDLLESGLDSCIASLQRSCSAAGGQLPYGGRSATLGALREFRALFREAQERALRALLFAKVLRRDLEMAAEFSIDGGRTAVLARLADTGHVRVIAPHSRSHIIFIPGSIRTERQYVWQLLDMRLSRQERPRPAEPGYLVLLACDHCGQVDRVWRGDTVCLEPTAETTISLSDIQVTGLLLVVNNASHLAGARKAFQRAMGACLSLQREETPPNRAITDALEELKEEALRLRRVVVGSVALVEERCSPMLEDPGTAPLAARCRQLIQHCFKFAFEYHRELARLVTGQRRPELAAALLALARHWIRHVLECEPRGQGLRPRWARDGLEFVSLCTEPQYTGHLADQEFQTVQREVAGCLRHLRGAAWQPTEPGPSRPPYRASRSLPPPASAAAGHRPGQLDSPPGLAGSRADSASPDRLSLDGLSVLSGSERAPLAVLELDARRDAALREQRRIGRVSERAADRAPIRARTVGFTWQMGFLIGQGRFGRVYTAVNSSSGELMAVKQIPLLPDDHRALRSAAQELKILEGIKHPHLVLYFGVEIHREEMFIFMEFCGEGTLESLSASLDCGLPEPLIRRYTKQLLSALACLHDHQIIHRDIKGANVFLTEECRCLKLGDFGCSVKMVAHTTMQGEVKGLVGTPAFMAPEVFTKCGGDGHGRAADVWSLACCVVEMATGKRPFPELEDTYQIMFRVGMGGAPALPERLSAEGGQFLRLCLVHDPSRRASAQRLLDHPFVKVESDGDEYLSSLNQSLAAGFGRPD